MAAPVWTAPRDWSVGDVLTQPRAQAYLGDNHQTRPVAATISALNALFGPEGAGFGASGVISVLDVGGTKRWDFPVRFLATPAVAAGKWCTDVQTLVHNGTTADTGTSYAITDRGPIMPYAVLVAAGMSLELNMFAVLNAGASSSEFVGALVTHMPRNGAPVDYTAGGSAEVSTASTTAVQADDTVGGAGGGNPKALIAGAVSAIGSDDYISLALGNKRSGSNAGNMRSGTTLTYRWVG